MSKILQSQSALEGERKQVAVLFADVKGSMELAEQLDPEQWHRILERFFEILTEGLHRFNNSSLSRLSADRTVTDHSNRLAMHAGAANDFSDSALAVVRGDQHSGSQHGARP